MSAADPTPTGPRPRPRPNAGYTFLEIVIVLGLLALVALITEKAMLSTSNTQRYLAAVRKATQRGHDLTYEIREKVTSSRRLFFDDAVGNGYLDALDLSRAPMVDWARLPTVDEDGRLGPDEPGDPRTGNVLFFVGEKDATPGVTNPATQTIRYIDTYNFICVYPRETARYVVQERNRKPALDLVLWDSVEFADFAQIMAVSDATERANLITDLRNNHDLDLAWDPTGTVSDSFYALSDLLAGGTPTPRSNVQLDEDEATSRGGRLVYASVQLARADIDEKRRRPMFATDDPGDFLPHGFEVKVIGPSGARQVWFHLVVEVQSAMGQVAVHPSTILANARDL